MILLVAKYSSIHEFLLLHFYLYSQQIFLVLKAEWNKWRINVTQDFN